MKQLQWERIIKEELDNVREEQNASLTDKMISALEDIGVDTEEDTVDVEINDEKTGKTRIVTRRNGEF